MTDLIGPPTCELIPKFALRQLIAWLGPDPLRSDFDPKRARAALERRPRHSIGDALLDQRVLAGIGNIYRNQALFLAGIHPLRRSGSVTEAEWERLWKSARKLMRRGVVQADDSHGRCRRAARASAFRTRAGRFFLRVPAGGLPPVRLADRR